MKKTIILIYFCFFGTLFALDKLDKGVPDSKKQELLAKEQLAKEQDLLRREASLLIATGLTFLKTPAVSAACKDPVIDN